MTIKVMVVDDEYEQLEYIKFGLEMCGFEVTAVSNALHAIEFANTINPDIIILDFMMPGIDGYSIYRGLSISDKTKDIPIIFITGHMVPEVADKIRETNAYCYLKKPFDITELIEKINSALGLKPALKK
ncbi:MAG: response regulator [Elusimicrobia bacterium]|nr:response regulator [Candidatus Liberimonas magnetica]